MEKLTELDTLALSLLLSIFLVPGHSFEVLNPSDNPQVENLRK
jgi:hypothetical protein